MTGSTRLLAAWRCRDTLVSFIRFPWSTELKGFPAGSLTAELGRLVRLPTEQEWECAAREEKGQEYAWGEEFDRNQINSSEFWAGQDDLSGYDKWKKGWDSNSEIPSTTLVGQFPAGATLEGVCDLSGNVWEWTGSWYEEGQVNRVLRGGSWGNARRYCRCAFRDGLVPVGFDDFFGFRVVSPGSDGPPERSAGDIPAS